MTAHRTARLVSRLVLSLLAGLLLVGTTATTAHAEDGYRFWGYYQWSAGQWAFAQKGADAVVPADGSVEGWRYAVGGAKPRVPRAAGDFETICGPTPAEPGKKRVAVVVDPGTPQDSATGQAPPPATGTCVVSEPKATGAKILAATAKVRIEKGLTCGIDGYPDRACGGQVKNIKVPAADSPVTLQIESPAGSAATPAATAGASQAPAPADAEDSGGATWIGIVLTALVVVLVAGSGLVLSRRRSGQA